MSDARLARYIERLETLQAEKQEVADQISDVFKELKGDGYDAKVVREVLRLRRMKPADRAEREELLETYLAALGDLRGTPLAQAAVTAKYGRAA